MTSGGKDFQRKVAKVQKHRGLAIFSMHVIVFCFLFFASSRALRLCVKILS
jgi:hypothetical protein